MEFQTLYRAFAPYSEGTLFIMGLFIGILDARAIFEVFIKRVKPLRAFFGMK